MRRGLVSWSREEVPAAVLERRVSVLQRAMAEQGFDAVVAYTSTVQPAAVSWLTQFVPYSNDGLLLVFPEGPPALFASFSKRVQGWIKEVSRVGEVGLGPKFAHAAVKMLKERTAASNQAPRIGFIGPDRIPAPVMEPFIEAGWEGNLLDAGELFARVRQPVDESEAKLLQRTAAMARQALDAIPAGASRASQVLSAIERTARLAGAEEVFPRIASDLASSGSLVRMEGDSALEARFAVQISLAYKGVWVRAARCVARGGVSQSWSAAESWFRGAVSRLRADRLGLPDDAPGKIALWKIESCLASEPFTVVGDGTALPPGSFGVASVELALPDGPWHGCSTFILGSGREATRLLG